MLASANPLRFVLETSQWKFYSQATIHERFYNKNLMNNLVQSNSFHTDIDGAMESVRIKRDEFVEKVRAFFPQGQSKLSV